MRAAIAFLILLMVPLPVLAQDWDRYVNERYGFTVDIPSGFAPTEDIGDGQIFTSADGTARLVAMGGNSFDDIEALGQRHMGHDASDGWSVTIDGSTPRWVAYSGARNRMTLKVRLIPICARWQYARLELRYPDRVAADMAPIVERLAASLQLTGTASCP